MDRVAIFVDAENVTHWLKQDVVKALIAELLLLGQLIIRKAYGVLSRSQLTIHQATLNQQGFEIIHCYHPVSRKNTADIQMTVEVIESAFHANVRNNSHIGWTYYAINI